VQHKELSPAGAYALSGHIQWFDLLNRPLFAVLDELYVFSRKDHQKQKQT